MSTRGYYRNTRAPKRVGYKARRYKSVSQAVNNSYDKLKDQQKNKDVLINFANGAGTLTSSHGLQTGVLVNYSNTHNTNMHTLICEPVKFASGSGDPSGQVHPAGLRYFYKSIDVDVTLSSLSTGQGLTTSNPVDIEMMICVVKGSNDGAFGTTGAQNLFSLDANNEQGSTKVFKLFYKRYCLISGGNPIKIKVYKNIHKMMSSEDNTPAFGSEDRSQQRLCVVWRFLKNDATNNNTNNVACINGFVKSRCYEC